jgi:FixJ family two-component response regulator
MIFTMDDDAAVRDSLSLLLECEGFETQKFAS